MSAWSAPKSQGGRAPINGRERRDGIMRQARRAWRGQVTVEYMLVLVAILLAVIYAVQSILQPKTEAQFKQAGNMLDEAGNQFNTQLFPLAP